MTKQFKLIASILLLLTVGTARADITLKMTPYTGAKSKSLFDRLNAFTHEYSDAHSLVSKDYPYQPAENYKNYLPLYWHYTADNAKYKEPDTLYSLSFNGRHYLAGIVSFNPLLTAEPHCLPNDSGLPTAHCEHIAIRQLTCHLFLFDAKTLNLESVTPLKIARDDRPMPGQKERSYWYYNPKYPNDPRQIEGWPRCNTLLAVAPAKAVSDALLFTLGYSDSAEPASKHEEDYHPLFKTTVLTRFSTDPAGKLQVTQDDECLGNPNTYSTIGSARKALKQCEAEKAP